MWCTVTVTAKNYNTADDLLLHGGEKNDFFFLFALCKNFKFWPYFFYLFHLKKLHQKKCFPNLFFLFYFFGRTRHGTIKNVRLTPGLRTGSASLPLIKRYYFDMNVHINDTKSILSRAFQLFKPCWEWNIYSLRYRLYSCFSNFTNRNLFEKIIWISVFVDELSYKNLCSCW